ncbi:hypothetical protein SNK04_013967 [Fusarium graminearum]
MCGRFVQLPVVDFGQPGLADLAPAWPRSNPASTSRPRSERRQVTRLAGPAAVLGEGQGLQGSTINARIETVATKPAFRSAFKKRRCVIPMAGYYEWSVSPIDEKKDPCPLLPDGNLGTFTIITGDSSGVSADIHDRMPVWLQADQIDEWMAASPDDAMAMLLASEAPAMEAYRVSRAWLRSTVEQVAGHFDNHIAGRDRYHSAQEASRRREQRYCQVAIQKAAQHHGGVGRDFSETVDADSAPMEAPHRDVVGQGDRLLHGSGQQHDSQVQGARWRGQRGCGRIEDDLVTHGGNGNVASCSQPADYLDPTRPQVTTSSVAGLRPSAPL